MAEPRPFLQFKAQLQGAILNGSGTCASAASGDAVELPEGRLSLRLAGEVRHASPLLAWLNRDRVEGQIVVNTETGAVFIQLYLNE